MVRPVRVVTRIAAARADLENKNKYIFKRLQWLRTFYLISDRNNLNVIVYKQQKLQNKYSGVGKLPPFLSIFGNIPWIIRSLKCKALFCNQMWTELSLQGNITCLPLINYGKKGALHILASFFSKLCSCICGALNHRIRPSPHPSFFLSLPWRTKCEQNEPLKPFLDCTTSPSRQDAVYLNTGSQFSLWRKGLLFYVEEHSSMKPVSEGLQSKKSSTTTWFSYMPTQK